MIAVRKTERSNLISSRAKSAIAAGIARGDAVAQLEYLGFSPRYMNLLENSEMGIITLEQLLTRKRTELLEIPGFGQCALNELFGCLARYHELDDAIVDYEEEVATHGWGDGE